MSEKGHGVGQKPENGPTPKNPESKESERDLSKLNYYDRLGVPRTATPDEIKSAYRSLASRLHPDKKPEQRIFGGYTEFILITEAYNHLKDENQKRRYDARLDYEQSPYTSRAGQSQGGAQSSSRPSDARSGFEGFGGAGFNYDDFFRDFEARYRQAYQQSGGGAPRPGAETEPTEDIEAQIAYAEQRAQEDILYHQSRRDEDVAYYTSELNEAIRYSQSEISSLTYDQQRTIEGLKYDKDQSVRSLQYDLSISQSDPFSQPRKKAEQKAYYERKITKTTTYYDIKMAEQKAYYERKIAEQKSYGERKSAELKQAIEKAKSTFEQTKKRITEEKERTVKPLKEKLKTKNKGGTESVFS